MKLMQIESALFCHIFSVQRYEGPDDEAITSKDFSQLGYPNFLILDSNVYSISEIITLDWT